MHINAGEAHKEYGQKHTANLRTKPQKVMRLPRASQIKSKNPRLMLNRIYFIVNQNLCLHTVIVLIVIGLETDLL